MGTPQVDVAVIGGGIAGLSTAYWLTKRGCSCAVLEARTFGSGATGAAAGMLAPVHELEFTEVPLLYAGLASQQLYQHWAAILPDFGYQPSGILDVALVPNDVPFLKRRLGFMQQHGLTAQWVAGDALREKAPGLSHQLPGGIWAPGDAHVNPRKLVKALVQYLTGKGANLHEQAPVTSLPAREAGRWRLPLPGGGECQATTLVVATGTSWPDGIAAYANAPQVYPVKGQVWVAGRYAQDDAQQAHALLDIPVRISSKAFGAAYLVPRDQDLILGSTSEERGFDNRLTVGASFDLFRKAYATLPGLYEAPIRDNWVGFRPATPTRLPVIAALSEGLFVVNGLHRHGILLGPYIGRKLMEWVLDGKAFQLPDRPVTAW